MEPEIVSYGREFICRYSETDYMGALSRAFKEKRSDFIILDDNMRGQRFLAACVAWAINKGWLHNDRNQSDGQSKLSSFRLTEEGKNAILYDRDSA